MTCFRVQSEAIGSKDGRDECIQRDMLHDCVDTLHDASVQALSTMGMDSSRWPTYMQCRTHTFIHMGLLFGHSAGTISCHCGVSFNLDNDINSLLSIFYLM